MHHRQTKQSSRTSPRPAGNTGPHPARSSDLRSLASAKAAAPFSPRSSHPFSTGTLLAPLCPPSVSPRTVEAFPSRRAESSCLAITKQRTEAGPSFGSAQGLRCGRGRRVEPGPTQHLSLTWTSLAGQGQCRCSAEREALVPRSRCRCLAVAERPRRRRGQSHTRRGTRGSPIICQEKNERQGGCVGTRRAKGSREEPSSRASVGSHGLWACLPRPPEEATPSHRVTDSCVRLPRTERTNAPVTAGSPIHPPAVPTPPPLQNYIAAGSAIKLPGHKKKILPSCVRLRLVGQGQSPASQPW